MNLKQELSKIIKAEGLSQAQIFALLETPPKENMGDLSLPCFTLAKEQKKNPLEIAKTICEANKDVKGVLKAEVAGGYANFTLDRLVFTGGLSGFNIEKEIKADKVNNKGKTVLIDFSSINIAKHPHIGHLSTTVIGAAIARIHEFFGYDVKRLNYVGDYGTQFGKLLVAYRKWGNKEDVEKRGISALQELYVRINKECETDEKLLQECRDAARDIAAKVKDALNTFEWFKTLTLEEVKKIYGPLKLKFDDWTGEFYYADKVDSVYKELTKNGLARESEGALIVDLEEYGLGVCVVRQSNGASLYITRDIAALEDRAQTYSFDKCVYVTAIEQNLHFKQLFKITQLLGYPWAGNLVHANYGRYSLSTGKLSSRGGAAALITDIFSAALSRAQLVLATRGGMANEGLARDIGIGALVFGALKRERLRDIEFDLEAALNFEGDTSVYIQYTHARCASVIEKAGDSVRNYEPEGCGNLKNDKIASLGNANSAKAEHLTSDEAWTLLKQINAFTDTLKLALLNYEPSEISKYLLNLCAVFNVFYAKERIVTKNLEETASKLHLVRLTKEILKTGLTLLGLAAPERM